MALLRRLIYWEISVVFFLTVFPYLTLSDVKLPVGSDDIMDDRLTGHVRVKRAALPAEILSCLTQPVVAATSDCPLKHSQWNNVHCFNDSFMIYTSQNNFINFGVGPLGVLFSSLLFNPPVSYSGIAGNSWDSNKKDKIKALLKSNAEASMTITFLRQMAERLQRDKEKTKMELNDMKENDLKQREQVNILKVHVERLEEEQQQRLASKAEQSNASGITLSAARDHIRHPISENKFLLETNKTTLKAEESKNGNCWDKYEDSKAQLTTLENKVSELTNTSDTVQLNLDQCTQELRESRTELQKQTGSHSDQKQKLQTAQAALQLSENQRSGAEVKVSTLERQLELCRANHMETTGESLVREQELGQCRQTLTDREADRLQQVEQLQQRHNECQSDMRSSADSLNKFILASEHCQRELKTKAEEIETSVKSLQACLADADGVRLRNSNMKRNISNLESDAETSKSRLEAVQREYGDTRDQLSSCQEAKEKQQLQLSDVTEDLEECRRSAPVQTPPPTSDRQSVCPLTELGQSVPFGPVFQAPAAGEALRCVLVTSSTGTYEEMKKLCRQMKHGNMFYMPVVSEEVSQQELPRLVADGSLAPADVWLRSGFFDYKCYSLDLTRGTGETLEAQPRECSDKLHGLCMSSFPLEMM